MCPPRGRRVARSSGVRRRYACTASPRLPWARCACRYRRSVVAVWALSSMSMVTVSPAAAGGGEVLAEGVERHGHPCRIDPPDRGHRLIERLSGDEAERHAAPHAGTGEEPAHPPPAGDREHRLHHHSPHGRLTAPGSRDHGAAARTSAMAPAPQMATLNRVTAGVYGRGRRLPEEPPPGEGTVRPPVREPGRDTGSRARRGLPGGWRWG